MEIRYDKAAVKYLQGFPQILREFHKGCNHGADTETT